MAQLFFPSESSFMPKPENQATAAGEKALPSFFS